MVWSPIPGPTDADSLYLLSAFCPDSPLVTANLVSVYDSQNVMDLAGHRLLEKNVVVPCVRDKRLASEIPDEVLPSALDLPNAPDPDQPMEHDQEEDYLLYSDEEDVGERSVEAGAREEEQPEDIRAERESQESERTEFWANYDKEIQEGRSPFFVDPFVMFPSPSKFELPVCDISGLCFSSSRPPFQVVVYPQVFPNHPYFISFFQVQLPLGVPSLSSELNYFSPLGPLLSSSAVLMDAALRCPVAEAPLSQLFTGLSGLAVMALDIPTDDESSITVRRSTLALGWGRSGRLLGLVVEVQPQRRNGILTNASEKEEMANEDGRSLVKEFIEKIKIPETTFCSRLGPVPGSRHFSEILQSGLVDEVDNFSKRVNEDSDHRMDWNIVPGQVIKQFAQLVEHSNKDKITSSIFGSRLQLSMKKTSCRSFHEYLECNEDRLVNPTFPMGHVSQFSRLKLETLPFWRHPYLDAMYWSEALMDILMGPLQRHCGPLELVPSIEWDIALGRMGGDPNALFEKRKSRQREEVKDGEEFMHRLKKNEAMTL